MSEKTKQQKHSNFEWLLSPWAIIVSMICGTLLGLYAKDITRMIAPYGQIYLAFLQMCILPILLAAVASSLGNLVKMHDSKSYIKKMIIMLGSALFLTSALGLTAGLVGKPGSGLNEKVQSSMGEYINKSKYAPDMEISLSEPYVQQEESSKIAEFIQNAVPSNVFSSLSSGRNLQVLFFAIILGLAVGLIQQKPSESFLTFLQAVYLSFSKIIRWAMYLLPFGLLCLLAEQVSKVGLDVLLIMTKFIIIFYITCGIILVINSIIIWKRSGTTLGATFLALKDTIIIALATRSSLATIPAALAGMGEELKFDRAGTNLILPLSVTLGRFGNVLYFALASIFVAQLYNTPIGPEAIGIILFGSILAGMATSGASGVLTLTMMLIVLEPLQLPFEAALVLFIAIDPIIDPIRTLVIVHTGCATTSAVAEIYHGESGERHVDSEEEQFPKEVTANTATA